MSNNINLVNPSANDNNIDPTNNHSENDYFCSHFAKYSFSTRYNRNFWSAKKFNFRAKQSHNNVRAQP